MVYLRSCIFNLYFYVVTFSMTVLCSPLLLLPRGYASAAMTRWAHWMSTALRAIAGIRVEVRGAEHLPHGPVLMAAKHQSTWDTFAFFTLAKDPAYVLKQELSYLPFYGWFAKKVAMVFVDRGAQAKALRHMIAQSKDRVAEGRSIVIFPEGTRSAPGSSKDYKPGVAALYKNLDIPCVPVALNSGLYWPRREFIRRPGTIVVEFLPAIEPGLPRKEFSKRLEQDIESACLALFEEGVADLKEQDAEYEPPRAKSSLTQES